MKVWGIGQVAGSYTRNGSIHSDKFPRVHVNLSRIVTTRQMRRRRVAEIAGADISVQAAEYILNNSTNVEKLYQC